MKYLGLRAPRLWAVVVWAVLVALSVVPVGASGVDGIVMLITELSGIDCAAGASLMGVIHNPYGFLVDVRIFVDVGGDIYTDALVSDVQLPPGTSTQVIVIPTTNTGGTATETWPLPTDQEVNVTIQLLDANLLQAWENRLLISQCNGGDLLVNSAGTVKLFTQNYSFEQPGTLTTQAAKWAAVVDNDKRVCNTDTVTVARSGECAFQFKGSAGVSTSLSQAYKLDNLAHSGDQFRLAAWVKGKNMAAGAVIKVTIKFPNQPKAVVTIPIPTGTYDYTYLGAAPLSFTQPPKNITLKVVAGNASGTFTIDDIQAEAAAATGPFALGSLPLPLPAAPAGRSFLN